MRINNIDQIIEHLERLTLQQEQLTQQIAELQSELRHQRSNHGSNNLRSTPSSTATRNRKRPIAIGDRVRIKNPRKGQSNTGIADSYTPSRLFVRIKLDNGGQIIKRAPSNLVHI